MTTHLTPTVYLCKPICICREANCGQPMDVFFQQSDFVRNVIFEGRTGYFNATCFNKSCLMYSVTRDPEHHETMSEEEREKYRNVRRQQIAAEQRESAILEYAFRRALNTFYACTLTVATCTLEPELQKVELERLAKMKYLAQVAPGMRVNTPDGYKVGPGAYFITPEGCELIGKDFAELGERLSHRMQWDLCVNLVEAGIDLTGVIDDEQQARVDWSLSKKLEKPQRKKVQVG